ncbi:MoaD/ThiS family protein [Sphingomonas sp. 28-63-12]|uniref:molybdopterin converting factor subunit 1 n=1 Tax=Sphingomonas sp. 28-63-12 TaxID=1970434 RepID=UPI000BD79816|nr:MAG: molybdopterin converting factor subunit 1 [Sphingomonas sp. 28-63-12]
MAIEMLYFAWVREQVGHGHESVSPPAGLATVADLIDWLSSKSPGHAAAFADRSRLRAAIDQRFGPLDSPIAGAREIAIFPPVTGG